MTRFEDEFATRLRVPYAVACATGTAAIHLALLAAGVEPGNEVWVSDLTFVASANPARYCGASVTLVDSEAETWNLNPSLVAEELALRAVRHRPMPAAIVVVHLLGHPARLGPILSAAAAHDVPVVEDAAEALGATWCDGPLAGRSAGAGAPLGCFSFNGNKVITTGGGGMVVTTDAALADRCRHLSTQAKLPGVTYRHDEVGYNYRLTNIAAALGVAQLEKLDRLLERKAQISHRYDAAFGGLAAMTTPPRQPWATSSVWLYSPLFATPELRDRVQLALAEHGIESRPVWSPLHEQAPYAASQVLGGGATAADIASRALSIPSSTALTESDQDRVIEIIADLASAG